MINCGITNTKGDYVRDIVPFPTKVEWNITDYCNLACPYCLNSSSPKRNQGLTTKECLYIVDLLSDGGVSYIVLIGGEPFTRNDIFTIMNRIKKRHMIMEIVTNGLIIDDSVMGKLLELNPNIRKVQLSLHLPEKIEQYKKVIKTLESNNIDVVTFVVVSQKNIEQIPSLFESIIEEEPMCFALGTVSGTGRASGKFYEDNCVSFGKLTELTMILEQIKSKSGTKTIVSYKDRRMLAEYLINKYNLHIMAHVCRAGIREFFIDGEGKATPCHFMDTNDGGQYKTRPLTEYLSLDKVWFSPEFKLFRENYLSYKSNRFVDSCRGCKHFKTSECTPCLLHESYCVKRIKEVKSYLDKCIVGI